MICQNTKQLCNNVMKILFVITALLLYLKRKNLLNKNDVRTMALGFHPWRCSYRPDRLRVSLRYFSSAFSYISSILYNQ